VRVLTRIRRGFPLVVRGSAVGSGSGYTGAKRRMKNLGLHVCSILVAVAVWCLIVSGAMVASQQGTPEDWHRAIGGIVTVLVLGLTVWLAVTKTHELLRRLGRAAVAVAIGDAGLGLLAGPPSAPTLPIVAMAHAFLGPILLSLLAAIAVATSRSWQSDPIFLQDQGWPPLRGVARNTLALVVIQVGLGAAFRYGSIGVMVHILGALIVVVFILTLVVLVTLMPEHPTLRPAAITLGVVTFVQIFLGLTVVSMGTAQANKGLAAGVAVAHVAMGAVTLATTLVVALEVWRNVRPAVQAAVAATKD
jgi:heme A synthase